MKISTIVLQKTSKSYNSSQKNSLPNKTNQALNTNPNFKSKLNVQETKIVTKELSTLIAGLALWKSFTITKTEEENRVEKYPKDLEYKKAMLKDSNLPESNYKNLNSIIGIEEFKDVIKKIEKTKANFMPGKRNFRENGEPYFVNNKNVDNGTYIANLHIHTTHSDGKLTIPELLEQAKNYADNRVSKFGEKNPFYIAITDHDNFQGCKEAFNIIYKNPEKYKNLRIILGVEHSLIADYPENLNGPVMLHMISYNINPFDKKFNDFFNKSSAEHGEYINNALISASEKYSNILGNLNIKFTQQEMMRTIANIMRKTLLSDNHYFKDYTQFKLIYSQMIENNEELSQILKNENIQASFLTPIALINENLNSENGPKHYELYFNALKQDLKNKLGEKYYLLIENSLPEISKELIKVLDEIEKEAFKENSDLYIPQAKFRDFKSAVSFIGENTEVNIGMAHPGVVFPFSNLGNKEQTVKFYDKLYEDFIKLSKGKAIYTEDNYATFFKNNFYLAESISEKGAKYGFLKTGGLDTHANNIFEIK